MKPHISEFSYGFALTNELVGWAELSAAPVFPSLIEEGREGGGYDVKLERPGVPLYLQFKRSEFMTRRNAREAREAAKMGVALNVPYYRFSVTDSDRSDQHELLLALDVPPNFVFYAAPRFYKLSEINEAWKANSVASRSHFIAPQEIGTLTDGPHTVAFDGRNVLVCSEPSRIKGLSSLELAGKLREALNNDKRSLGEKLPEFVKNLRDAEDRGRSRIRERQDATRRRAEENERRRRSDFGGFDEEFSEASLGQSDVPSWRVVLPDLQAEDSAYLSDSFEPGAVPTREAKALPPEFLQLREAADTAARLFDTQLVIVQPNY